MPATTTTTVIAAATIIYMHVHSGSAWRLLWFSSTTPPPCWHPYSLPRTPQLLFFVWPAPFSAYLDDTVARMLVVLLTNQWIRTPQRPTVAAVVAVVAVR